MSDSLKIHERIALVMKELRGVEKGSRNQHGNYAYAGHEAVTAAVRPLFVKHGIVQTITVLDMRLLKGGHVRLDMRVTWSCVDNPESCIWGTVPAIQHAQTKGGTVTAQQVGQAISYAVKNFTFKTLMLTDSNEPDSDAGPLEAPRREPANDNAIAAATAMLGRFTELQTIEEIRAHVQDSKAKWATVNSVEGMAARFTHARDEALASVRGHRT